MPAKPIKPAADLPLATLDAEDLASRHRIPVIDKMVQIIDIISTSPKGVSIGNIVSQTDLPRSTVYRVLNTLHDHGFVRKLKSGQFALGFRFLSLAAKVDRKTDVEEVVLQVRPSLEHLAQTLRETCKLSMLEDGLVHVIDVVQSPDPIAPSSRAGSKFPAYVSAAGKVLVAYASPSVRAGVMRQKRQKFTSASITTASALEAELDAIMASGVGLDRGEWNESVCAIAAPIRSFSGEVICAVSVTFFAARLEKMTRPDALQTLRAAAARASAALGYTPTASDLD